MGDSYVTIQGWVGSNVDAKDAKGVPLATFRLGSTPRFRRDGDWVDGPTSWFTVNCWRGLANNVQASVHVGDPVIVHGRVRVDVWERGEDQPPSVKWFVDATWVGHDMTKGISTFLKPARPEPDQARQDEPVDDAA
jgi:single-strand DNA-binding protein